ncbi:MAG: type II toxin-antitoxin system YoeB family toxin [Synergistaceae bacterium]|jgi:toxin YoeB|nr:type II toxin-antitoxin system YoeB family toxin [Synergistaceae bacterium]
MIKTWHETAWADYEYWQTQDKKTLRRINLLLKDIERNAYDCIGRPEFFGSQLGKRRRALSPHP